VNVDKKTYKAYRQLNEPELGSVLREHVHRDAEPTDSSYATLHIVPETRGCVMMKDQLCSIQAKLGESYLPNICFSFPRVTRTVGGQAEQALTLSCPEAARQALLAPDAFDFIESPVTVRAGDMVSVGERHGVPAEVVNELRIFCLNLMRLQGPDLWERLALLGALCESLNLRLAEGQGAGVRAAIDEFTALLEEDSVFDALRAIEPNHVGQALVFSVLWSDPGFGIATPSRAAVTGRVAQGLGADPASGKVDAATLVAHYRIGLARLPEALEAAPHLLEHYVLNEMFANMFPFDGGSPYESFLQLVSRFGVLRLMLAAQCHTDGPLPDAAALVQTTQVHCRRFQHNLEFARKVKQSLVEGGWASLAKLSSLLRP
jgi:lysine-N-methylase